MAEKKKREQIAADALMKALLARLQGRDAGEVAALAHVQGVMTKCAAQAIIEILMHKNIITEADLGPILAYHYNRSHDQLTEGSDTNRIMRPSDPIIAKPS